MTPDCTKQEAHFFRQSDAKTVPVDAVYLSNILALRRGDSFTAGESHSILFVPSGPAFEGCYFTLEQPDPHVRTVYTGEKHWVREAGRIERSTRRRTRSPTR